MKKLAKIIAVLLCLVLILSLFSGCKEDRSTVLRIYNWEDYIDPDLLDEFVDYYYDKYGVTLTISYETFDTNETMYTKIEKAHEDYDLCAPSEYMIEKMKNQGLIQKMDETIVGSVYNQNVPEYIRKQFAIVTGNTDTDIYAVGYMWGTLGIIYNKDAVPLEELEEKGWGILWDEKYAGKIFMKDSIRDSYAVGNLYVFRDTYFDLRDKYDAGELSLEEYQSHVLELFNRTDEETVALIEEALITQKDTVDAMYDVDNDKNAMVNGTAYLDVAWSGDARWAIIESNEADNGVNLGYFIPREGTNVWFDGWVIPKYAKNVLAANEFAAFLMRPENAIRIMDYIGYPSCVGGEEVYEYAKEQAFEDDTEELDISYFFEGADPAIVTDTMYPDLSQIISAAAMQDFGSSNDIINDMWARVKGNTLTPMIIIVDSLVAVALIYLVVRKIVLAVKKKSKKA